MPDDQSKVRSFNAILGDRPYILILGTMPGVLSLERGRYYEDPRNCFWRLISDVLEETEPKNYECRINMLKRRHIALWNVLRSCDRSGSLDKDICGEEHNDIASLLDQTPTIRAICFNGRKTAEMYDKDERNQRRENLEYRLLPSSSGKLRKRFHEQRSQEWRALRQLLTENPKPQVDGFELRINVFHITEG
ncbi:MAG: DNA-deoxyinosine glycosylase [Synergistaceae bacterium]|jgi:TDG/mug DNA glycosylase family protein|nr:DNA-deoxyinosine glycosylase [Synergistaceae bacterium]